MEWLLHTVAVLKFNECAITKEQLIACKIKKKKILNICSNYIDN